MAVRFSGIIAVGVFSLFGLTACGGGGGGDAGGNLPPTVTAFCGATPQESQLTGFLLATDPNSDALTFSLNADGSGLNGPISTAKGQVEIIDSTTGAFSYTPNAHPSRRGADTFEFRVEDTAGNASSGVAKVIIEPRILTLGDSITQGVTQLPNPPKTIRVGYRRLLHDQLLSTGYRFDLVGARSDLGNGVTDFDFHTEGYAGAFASEFAANGGFDDEGGLNAGPSFQGITQILGAQRPDIILMHVGTNDIVNLAQNPADVTTIMTKINTWETTQNGNPVAVILARIIDQCFDDSNFPASCGTGDAAVATFNNQVVSNTMTLNPSTGPDEIIYVDQQAALRIGGVPDWSLFTNALHPNDQGYARMADTWYNQLTDLMTGPSILEKCP